MRRVLTTLAVAVTAAVLPGLSWAGNQQVAERIAKGLRDSGQLSNYRIAVKYQDGTAWLKGRVQSQLQMNTALKLVLKTAGVNRVVNKLTLNPATAAATTGANQPTATETTQPTATETTRPEAAQSPQPEAPQTTRRPTAAAAKPAIGPPTRPAADPPSESKDKAADPRRPNPFEWLKKAVVRTGRQPEGRSPLQPGAGRTAGRAERVPSSFRRAPARQVGVRETQVGPQEAVPGGAVGRFARRPVPIAYMQGGGQPQGLPLGEHGNGPPNGPLPVYVPGTGGGVAPARYDQPHMPNYSWPSYAAYPNYAALTYPRQYSPTAWPYIGPFYPYPQVPLGWRKVVLDWDDGWWMLDFKDSCW